MSDNGYTNEEEKYIRQNYNKIPTSEISEEIDRSVGAIQMKASRLGVTKSDFEINNMNPKQITTEQIEPYSEYIDKKTFEDSDLCWFISGIVTAEGSFSKYSENSNLRAQFEIGMSDRDEEVIAKISEFFDREERVYENPERESHNPTMRFVIGSIQDIIEEIIPFFEKYPLRGKKYNQYVEWRDVILDEYDLQLD